MARVARADADEGELEVDVLIRMPDLLRAIFVLVRACGPAREQHRHDERHHAQSVHLRTLPANDVCNFDAAATILARARFFARSEFARADGA
jgi:hypothetical protein